MRLSNKLDFPKLGPFKLIKVLKPVIYKLDFPDSIISVLELIDPKTPLMENIPDINLNSQKKV